MKENPIRSLPGIPYLFGVLLLTALAVWRFVSAVNAPDGMVSGWLILGSVVVAVVALLTLIGLYMVEPNQAAVLSLFGKYVGTVKENGLRWNNPFYAKRKVSQRVRNFESEIGRAHV